MTEQLCILEDSMEWFKRDVAVALRQGYKVIPGTPCLSGVGDDKGRYMAFFERVTVESKKSNESYGPRGLDH